MPAAGSKFEMLGGVPVLTAPAEIDITTAGHLAAILSDLFAQGQFTVVVDMTATQRCDPAAMRKLALAHHQAQAEGGGLQLVIPPASDVLRVLTMTGLGRMVASHASREAALSRAIGSVIWNAHSPADAAGAVRKHGPSDAA